MMSDAAPDVSVVIVSYNTRHWLADCLESLLAETGISFEVILVDNASSDDSLAMVRERFPDVRIIENRENVGFPAANNQGFSLSRGRYIFMLNPDTVVHRGALAALVKAADALPDGGIFGTRTLDGDDKIDLTAFPFPTLTNVLYDHWQIHRLLPGKQMHRYRHVCQRAESPAPVEWVQGCSLMLRQSLRQDIGDLDPQFFLFSEEVDYAFRAQQRGWRVYYVPSAVITHFGAKSTTQNIPHKIRSYHQSKIRFFRKYRSRPALWLLRAGFLLELAVKIPVRLFQWVALRRSVARDYLRAYWQTAHDCLRF